MRVKIIPLFIFAILLSAIGIYKLSFSLNTRNTYPLTIESDIMESQIYINGIFFGRTPGQFEIRQGKYDIVVVPPEGSGFEPVKRVIEVKQELNTHFIRFEDTRPEKKIVGYGGRAFWAPDSKRVALQSVIPLVGLVGYGIYDTDTDVREELKLPNEYYDVFGWLDNEYLLVSNNDGFWAVSPTQFLRIHDIDTIWAEDLSYAVTQNEVIKQAGKSSSLKSRIPDKNRVFNVSQKGDVLTIEQGRSNRTGAISGSLFLSKPEGEILVFSGDFIGAEFSPTAKYIAIQGVKQGDIVTLKLFDTEEGTLVLDLPWSIYTKYSSYDFTPEDNSLVYVNEDGELILVEIKTGIKKVIDTGLYDPAHPVVINDGIVLLFIEYDARNNQGSKLAKLNLATSESQIIGDTVDCYFTPELSPNCQKVIYKTLSEHLILVDL